MQEDFLFTGYDFPGESLAAAGESATGRPSGEGQPVLRPELARLDGVLDRVVVELGLAGLEMRGERSPMPEQIPTARSIAAQLSNEKLGTEF